MVERELVFLNTSLQNQYDVLEKMIDKAEGLGYVKDKEEFLKAILEREKMLSTSIDFKVAIPHGRSQAVNKPFIAFMKTKEEFVWDTSKGESIDLIFMIGIPEENKDNLHLKCLSLISKKLMQEEFRNTLRNAMDEEEAFHLLDEINKKMEEK